MSTDSRRKFTMSTVQTYTVAEKTCEHCVASVSEEVQEISGVEDVQVVLETGSLTVTTSQPIDDAEVQTAVESAGYQLA
jgi:copper chaperone CopZ